MNGFDFEYPLFAAATEDWESHKLNDVQEMELRHGEL